MIDLIKYAEGNVLKVHVIPNAKENKVSYNPEKGILLRLKAPAIDGKANSELMKYLKKIHGLKVTILKGHNSRDKTLSIDN